MLNWQHWYHILCSRVPSVSMPILVFSVHYEFIIPKPCVINCLTTFPQCLLASCFPASVSCLNCHLVFVLPCLQRSLSLSNKSMFEEVPRFLISLAPTNCDHIIHLNTVNEGWHGRCMYSYQTVTVRTSRFGARGLPIQEGAPAVIQRCLITASTSRRTANAVSCTLETVTMCGFWKLLTQTDKIFVLVYPTSLIRHKSKYFHVCDVTYQNAKLLFIM